MLPPGVGATSSIGHRVGLTDGSPITLTLSQVLSLGLIYRVEILIQMIVQILPNYKLQ